MNGVQLARNYCSAAVPRKTFSNQEKLPPLPVPPLKDTIDKFLRTAVPVAESTLGNPDLFRKTEELAQDLLRPGGVGERLQKKLEERGKTHKNWLEDWWLSQAYLAWPDPIPIYSNYYFLFDEELKGTSQTLTAAKYISGIIQYKQALDAEQIPAEYMQKTTPMCMHQYTKLFTTARVPGEKEDSTVSFKPSQHVVVISNKQHFVLEVFNGQQPLTTQEIEAQLSKILSESKKQIPSLGLGVLTGVSRPVWAQVRDRMIKLDNNNKTGFEAIERALAVIVLDPATPSNAEEAGRLVLGGDASHRWFDKLSEVIVFANGRGGFSGEHSPLDAIATASLSGYLLNSAKHDLSTISNNKDLGQQLPLPKKITWVMDKEVVDNVEKASKDYNAFFEDHDYALLYFKNYGSSWIKEVAKMSPDSYAQMAIQLAYFKLHNKGVGTYETAQTRQFYHGRTETCRSFSKESLDWTKSMSSKEISNETKLNLLKKAVDSHKKYMSEAVAGKAIDRHLLGLRLVAAEEKVQLPPLFSDPVYKASCTWRLSTSNITQNGLVAGYGPAVEDGYGICYGTRKDLLHFSVSSRVSNKTTSTPKMRDALVQSLNEMQALFSNQNPTAKL